MVRKFICPFIILIFILTFSCSNTDNKDFSERVKVSLREVGNQLLLSNKDSTSIILPVVALEESKYRLSFQNHLWFEPNNLVSIVRQSFKKTLLPNHYRVEVIQCIDNEVAYSYEINAKEENTIIPCVGRVLPKACYLIEIRFIKKTSFMYSKQVLIYSIIFSIVLLLVFNLRKRKKDAKTDNFNLSYTKIGSFQFYAEQNKLIKEALEINLSKKECELLEIFVANPNQIIKRDELTKKVWEDNGVFVGRSLDTYISKLRKKLKEDNSIKLVNIHGVGYKLEIVKNN